MGRISSLMNPLTFVLINVAAAVLIWVGAVRVDAGFLTQGAVVALLNYMSQILVELIKMANLIINISKALACANRIFQCAWRRNPPSLRRFPQRLPGKSGARWYLKM